MPAPMMWIAEFMTHCLVVEARIASDIKCATRGKNMKIKVILASLAGYLIFLDSSGLAQADSCRDIWYRYVQQSRGAAAYATTDGLPFGVRHPGGWGCWAGRGHSIAAASQDAVMNCNRLAQNHHLSANCKVMATHM